MKGGKLRGLKNFKLLLLVGVIFLALIFTGLSSVQAQVQIKKKPPKPRTDNYTWGIILPSQTDYLNLYGPEIGGSPMVFKDANSNYRTHVQNANTSSGEYWKFSLWVYKNDEDIKAGLQYIDTWPNVIGDGDIGPYNFPPGFVDGCGSEPPMDCFLNQLHPMPGYETFFMVLAFYADIEALKVGQSLPLNNPGNRLDFDIFVDMIRCKYPRELPWYSWVPVGCSPPINEGLSQFVIERESEDSWIIHVVDQEFWVKEIYQELDIKKRGKKEFCEEIIYYPFEGTTNLSYDIRLVKIHQD
jgi:hypothetical protein